MFSTYGAVFRAPATAAFSTAGVVARLAIAIYPIGIVLLVSARTGDYGFAGVLSACYILGGAPGNPLLARLADRFGQRRVLVPATFVHAAAVITLAVLYQAKAPDWSYVLPTFVAGFAYVSIGSMVRARWSLALAGRPELSTAYSLESTLDELVFVVGPLIASVLATQVSPVLVLYVAVVLTGAGVAWLASQRATEPPRHPAGAPRHPSALRERGMLLVVCAAAAMGAVFASAEVTLVAFCGQHHERGLSGLVIACMAGGSGVAGLYYGTRSWRSGVAQRQLYHSLVFAVLPLLFLAVVNVGVAAAIAFVVGLGIAPTLITTFGLVEQLVPPHSLTEGLSWPLTGLNIGYGIGSALVGGIADAHGARVAFTVTIAAGVLTGIVALVLSARLRASGPDSRTAVGSSEHAALP